MKTFALVALSAFALGCVAGATALIGVLMHGENR